MKKKSNYIPSHARILIVLAYALTLASLLLFLYFLYSGNLHLVNLGLTMKGSLLVNSGLSLLFFSQHSIMIRKSVQSWIKKCVPDHFYGAFYAISSGITLLFVLCMWQGGTTNIVDIQGYTRLGMRLFFFLTLAGFVWGAFSLRSLDIFGRSEIVHHYRGRKRVYAPLTLRGPYKYVRHPFYSLLLVLIWSSPTVDADRLLFDVFWSLWVIIGTRLEERDLVTHFGEDYVIYQNQVPMLFPFHIGRKEVD